MQEKIQPWIRLKINDKITPAGCKISTSVQDMCKYLDKSGH